MKKINITMKTKPDKIVSYFRQCKDSDTVNLKTDFGSIFMAGGFLCKLEHDKHYFAFKGKWVRL